MPYRARRAEGQPTIDLTQMPLADAIVELSGGKLMRPMHLRRLIEFFEAADVGQAEPTIVAVPPRFGKSKTVCTGLAWLLARHPAQVHGYITYSQRLSDRMSRDIRRMYELSGGKFSPDENRIEGWRNLDDGGLLAVGVQGPLTGFGISGVGVIDDPIKDRADAESLQVRDATWDWLGSVFATRLEPGSVPLVVATRWNQDDPSGRLIAGKLEEFTNWNVIHLPAIIAAEDGSESSLWPERWPLEKLLAKRGRFGGDRTWHALYQGNPLPDGGSLFGAPTFGEFPGDVARPRLEVVA